MCSEKKKHQAFFPCFSKHTRLFSTVIFSTRLSFQCHFFNQAFFLCTDKHVPLHSKHTKANYIPGWVNEAVIAAKETKRLCERIWCRNKSHFNRSQYMQKVHQYNRICMQAKSEFLKAKIQDNHHDPQKL